MNNKNEEDIQRTSFWNARNGGGVMTKGKENKLRQELDEAPGGNNLQYIY